MTTISIVSLVDAIRQYRLLETAQLEEVTHTLQARFPEPKALAKELLQRGWLTPYQANQLLQGRGQELVLGQYLLLERLGEGGMGQVFKVRHRNLGRIAAIKLIRKERLTSPDAVRRFEREVRAAAVLSHPHIVLAYDADQTGGRHLLVMEYVEGSIDLARLIKKNGPLPVAQACDYIRQAALGLQHAYERGLVHRDIKPHNLLLTADGKTLKVLDMGLARLDQLAVDDEKGSTMTLQGAIMGTPDYLSPEQAQESHTVDIRADLYSLGCTLYHVLTGLVPFPSNSVIDKLLKHRFEEPEPVEKLRPDVPPAVAGVVRKLMAKKPEDRYQTPAEVAAVLALLCSPRSASSWSGNEADRRVAEGPPAVAVSESLRDTLSSPFAHLSSATVESVDAAQPRHREAQGRRWLLSSLAVGAAVLVGVAVLLVWLTRPTVVNRAGEGNEDRRVIDEKPPPRNAVASLKQGAALLGGKWYYIGPFANPNMKGFDTVYPPEKEINLRGTYRGKNNKQVEWQEYRKFEVGRILNFLSLFQTAEEKVWGCIYLYHEIEVAEATSLPIFLGSDDTLTVWWNEECLLARKVKRAVEPDDDCIVLRLKPGKNKLLVKICQSIGEWGFFIAPRKAFFFEEPGFQEWVKEVAALPPGRQVEAVVVKLKEFNPDFDGTVQRQVEEGVVTSLELLTDNVTDISPVRALVGLKKLTCAGSRSVSWVGRGQLADLSPLQGLQLTNLSCCWTKVRELASLKGMPLTTLDCSGTRVADLSPLKDMNLTTLLCTRTRVSDLSPLKKMPLTTLHCAYTGITNLVPLKGLPLKRIDCDFRPERDAGILRSLKTLERINGKPATQFWREVDEKKLPKQP